MTTKYLRKTKVCDKLGISPMLFDSLRAKHKDFPQPMKLSVGVIVWDEAQIDEFVRKQTQATAAPATPANTHPDLKIATDGALLCPRCGFHYTHHFRVEVFDRNSEDSAHGVHVDITNGDAVFNTSMKGNPSRRRDAVNVYIECEECGGSSTLSIIQHKGGTYLEFGATKEVAAHA